LDFGLPRNDVLKKTIPNKAEICKKLHISNGDRFIIWLPTYRVSNFGDVRRDSTSDSFLDELEADFLEKLDALACDNDFYVIVKLHPMDSLNEGFEALPLSRVKLYSTGIWKGTGLDLYDVLSCSDGLVSDVSSVLIDYIVTKKPIGILKGVGNSYTRGTVFDLSMLDKFTYKLTEPGDFLNIVNNPRPPLSCEEMDVVNYLNDAEKKDVDSCSLVSHYFLSDLRKNV
jgi:CDP-glycerol glycerophosphotransferase (TagB/SpsB family)